jgi:hypothetical protein
LRWIQLRFQEYWSEAEIVKGPVELPNFKLLYESICYKQWMRPEIPVAYMSRKKPRVSESGINTGGEAARKKANKVPANVPAPLVQKHAYERHKAPTAEFILKGVLWDALPCSLRQ